MKILVNATTITVGGGVQAAVSFIEYATGLKSLDPSFAFALSDSVYSALAADVRSDPRIKVFDGRTAHPLRGLKARASLLGLEADFAPDLVYSIGFPSYVAFRSPEAGRYTNPWEICSLNTAWSVLPPTERITRSLRSFYRLIWARRARYFETQTEIAKEGIVRRLRVDPERILVLPNSVNPRFLHAEPRRPPAHKDTPRVLCLSAAHRHKNLTIIPEVAEILERKYRLAARFVVTLPQDSGLWHSISRCAARRDVTRLVENAGPLNLEGCVQQYQEADCLFLPTLAEIFSATYLEAMAMRVPIVTTDLDFAHEICADAAIYYDPLSAEAAARAIAAATTEDTVRDTLVANAARRLEAFPDPVAKHRLLLDWLVKSASGAAVSAVN